MLTRMQQDDGAAPLPCCAREKGIGEEAGKRAAVPGRGGVGSVVVRRASQVLGDGILGGV